MSSKTYNSITQAIWDCVKTTSYNQNGTIYDPADANQGTSTTDIMGVGKVVLTFDFDPNQETLEYTITQKPGIVWDSEIWSGIESSIEACGGSGS
jgi:hypothetical protein